MASVRLFNSTETDFSHNETVLNEIISCKVTEEINGDYTVELEYPLDDSKGISSGLVATCIIDVPTIDSRGNQRFRIIGKETTSDSVIVQAQAKLLADLKGNWIKATTITGKTRNEAITTILNAALESHDYTVGNYDTSTDTSNILNAEEGALLSSIIGDDTSILTEYGGEFIVNNDTISIVDERGSDNGVVIEYGKNISSIKETIDLTDLATVLIPKSGDYRLPEYYIESPLVGAYEKRYFQEVDMNLDIWDGEDEQGDDQITEEEAYVLMRKACNKMFSDDKVDQITFNYTVDFVELSKTEEYKDYKVLETVALGDTVTVKHKKLNLNLEGRVNKIVYTVDSEGITTIDTVEIGFTKKDITDIINTTIRNIKFTEQQILLQVSNLDNTLTSKIELTAEQIQSTVTDTKNQLESQITQTASEIRTEVSNADSGLQSQITQQAGQIQSTVSELNGAKSQITQLSDEISTKVDEGEFSSLIQQNAQSVAIAIKSQTDMNVVFDSNGQLIKNGALEVQDSSGETLMYFDDDKGILGTKDLSISDTSKGSAFYNTLMGMDEVYFPNIGCGTLYVNDKSIEEIIYDKLVEYNLV